jgi:hypothetical protein
LPEARILVLYTVFNHPNSEHDQYAFSRLAATASVARPDVAIETRL